MSWKAKNKREREKGKIILSDFVLFTVEACFFIAVSQ